MRSAGCVLAAALDAARVDVPVTGGRLDRPGWQGGLHPTVTLWPGQLKRPATWHVARGAARWLRQRKPVDRHAGSRRR